MSIKLSVVIETMLNKVRIIAGQWRGRTLEFPESPGLRPTANRIRETLFNWLAPYIRDAYFLDAFGGSGALSFEALSRGAMKGVYMDSQASARLYCHQNAKKLHTTDLSIVAGEAPGRFANLKADRAFDIVFLDPPFQHNLLLPSLQALIDHRLIQSHSLIYFETEKAWRAEAHVDPRFSIVKQQQAGLVNYGLLRLQTLETLF